MVRPEDIFAIGLLWDEAGNYADFTRDAPTARSGGKAAVVSLLTERYGSVVMVGDGATDMEARDQGAADAFIGYGGFKVRESIQAGACWFVHEMKEMTETIQEAPIPSR